MAKVHVITDSTADIPDSLRDELGIGLVPLKVHLGNQSYLDRVNIHPQEFYTRLKEVDDMPTTSQPSPVDFVEAYREAAKDGDKDILSIHLSSSLSGTYQSALLAQSMVEDELKVTVIDSKKASFTIGLVVVEVARAAKAGKSIDECVELAHRLFQSQQVYFLVDTLEYLQKGGRIGKASAVLGSLLNIKPILSLNSEGVVYPVDKVRGKNKAMAKIQELLREQFGDQQVQAAVLCTDNLAEGDQWERKLVDEFNIRETNRAEIGPVIGAHVGPGTLAVVFQPIEG
ncbi:EDD domain protein, DegV family [Marininema mesophilum]|uniref:EDD domain protein, DegV family n=1 Tax=Marininema mesophilum TaxID=1048340 RepID=A0A1H2Q3J8_9BACL|nr:DegV family protein [Marininema mesophilum]SDW01746.1 EDD domain protein, DegV family [Marininema mesophilum]